MRVVVITISLTTLLLLASCSSTPPQQLDPALFYKRDITVQLGEWDYEGVSVLPKQASYNLLIKPVGKMDLMLVTTCHREETFTPTSTGFFKKDNSFEYTYTPQKGIEDAGSCPLRIDAFDKKKGQHSWFFADFEGSESLKATVLCNGTSVAYKGVSVCQSKSGLIQKIQFAEPVEVHPEARCQLPEMVDNAFEYKIAKDECVYAFKGTETGAIHRHTTIGYEGVLVREAL